MAGRDSYSASASGHGKVTSNQGSGTQDVDESRGEKKSRTALYIGIVAAVTALAGLGTALVRALLK